MLKKLSIRDFVLISRLDLSFSRGLSVLTGETGAGKSILLDALGLALGARADIGLIRNGASQASVTVAFEHLNKPKISDLLEEIGLNFNDSEDTSLILRRVLNADGRSRAFVNETPVSVSLLNRLGSNLVEIQSQFEAHGLLDAKSHCKFLDEFAGNQNLLLKTRQTFESWRKTRIKLEQAFKNFREAEQEEEYLRHSLKELKALIPQKGEEEQLLETRSVLANAEQILGALGEARQLLTGERGASDLITLTLRILNRIQNRAGRGLERAVTPLERAASELFDAEILLTKLADQIEVEGGRLQELDDRLHALRGIARKHSVEIDDLIGLQENFEQKLCLLELGDKELKNLEQAMLYARGEFLSAAGDLSASRNIAGSLLADAVMTEFPELKLEKAKLFISIKRLDETLWGSAGYDEVSFDVAMNPGSSAAPLARIASGGELSRLLLALRAVLVDTNPIPTLIFDEVDAGIGGAVADSVGVRLKKLSDQIQVLVVTHSPQVAAKARIHWRIIKREQGTEVYTVAQKLGTSEQREEIARMLSGENITNEARAAAASLLKG